MKHTNQHNQSPHSRFSQDEDFNSLSWLGDLLDPNRSTNDRVTNYENQHIGSLIPHYSRQNYQPLIGLSCEKGTVQRGSNDENSCVMHRNIINRQNPIELQDQEQVIQPLLVNHSSFQQQQSQRISIEHQSFKPIAFAEQPQIDLSSQSLNLINNSISSIILPSTQMNENQQFLSKYNSTQQYHSKPTFTKYQSAYNVLLHQNQQPILSQPINHEEENREDKISDLAPKYKKINKLLRLIKKRKVPKQSKHQQEIIAPINHQPNNSLKQQTQLAPEVSQVLSENILLPVPQKYESVPQKQNIGLQQSQQCLTTKNRLTARQQRIASQFESMIKIVNQKCIDKDIKYRWELGTLRVWNNISEALKSNFYIFIKHSTKYKSKFQKYIPNNAKVKAEGLKKQFKMPHNIKSQKLKETKIRNKRIELVNLKQIFNQIQLSKIIDYQRGKDEPVPYQCEVDQNDFSEYEPQSPIIQSMIEELVVRTNIRIMDRKHQEIRQDKQGQLKAIDELFIYRLNKASQQFNYVNNMKSILSFNTKNPTLSCLTEGGLGLRSNNLKIITKQVFQHEMNQKKLMNQATILSDQQEKQAELQASLYRKLQ